MIWPCRGSLASNNVLSHASLFKKSLLATHLWEDVCVFRLKERMDKISYASAFVFRNHPVCVRCVAGSRFLYFRPSAHSTAGFLPSTPEPMCSVVFQSAVLQCHCISAPLLELHSPSSFSVKCCCEGSHRAENQGFLFPLQRCQSAKKGCLCILASLHACLTEAFDADKLWGVCVFFWLMHLFCLRARHTWTVPSLLGHGAVLAACKLISPDIVFQPYVFLCFPFKVSFLRFNQHLLKILVLFLYTVYLEDRDLLNLV